MQKFIYSNSVRRFIGPMTAEEALLLERLEQQRRRHHRVRAYIADPCRKFTRIIAAYIRWLQLRIHPGSDTLISAPRAPGPIFRGLHYNTARAPLRCHGAPLCVNRCVILDADRLSPSRPYRDSRLDLICREALGFLPARADSVLIILGNPYRRRRNRYRHYWLRERLKAQAGEEQAYLLIDPADPASALLPKQLHPPTRPVFPKKILIPNPQLLIPNYQLLIPNYPIKAVA